MEGQRQKAGGGRRRRRKARNQGRPAAPELVLIAARRPNSPLLPGGNGKGAAAASAVPAPRNGQSATAEDKPRDAAVQPQRRAARIVQAGSGTSDEREALRERLLERLLLAEGRGAVSKAARVYAEEGFTYPETQEAQLQLLEHVDETVAGQALQALERLLEREPVQKKPILDQRLRRLEEHAEEAEVREAAARLRRAVR